MQGSVLALGKCLACLEFMCKYGLGLDSHSVNKKKIGILSRILVFCTTSSKEEAPTALRVGFLQQRVCSVSAGMRRGVGRSLVVGPRLTESSAHINHGR